MSTSVEDLLARPASASKPDGAVGRAYLLVAELVGICAYAGFDVVLIDMNMGRSLSRRPTTVTAISGSPANRVDQGCSQ